MAMKRMMLAAALVGGAAALAVVKPSKPTRSICGIICVDSVNECGQKFGGCYDPCVDPVPTSPPCTAPYLMSWYPTPTPTTTTTISSQVYNCSTITVCVDGINSCGIPFGACIPDCKPWNIVTPPCPADDFDIVPWIPPTETMVVETSMLVTPALETSMLVTPALETTVLETPASETPASETPVSETPIIDVPIVEGPVADATDDAEDLLPEDIVPWIPDDSDDWFE